MDKEKKRRGHIYAPFGDFNIISYFRNAIFDQAFSSRYEAWLENFLRTPGTKKSEDFSCPCFPVKRGKFLKENISKEYKSLFIKLYRLMCSDPIFRIYSLFFILQRDKGQFSGVYILYYTKDLQDRIKYLLKDNYPGAYKYLIGVEVTGELTAGPGIVKWICTNEGIVEDTKTYPPMVFVGMHPEALGLQYHKKAIIFLSKKTYFCLRGSGWYPWTSYDPLEYYNHRLSQSYVVVPLKA